jgi:hypothetical protein
VRTGRFNFIERSGRTGPVTTLTRIPSDSLTWILLNHILISFRWSNHSITSKFIIKYCYYGSKFNLNSSHNTIKSFFRVHKVLNNNIQLDLKFTRKEKRPCISISFICAMFRYLTLLCLTVLCKQQKKYLYIFLLVCIYVCSS